MVVVAVVVVVLVVVVAVGVVVAVTLVIVFVNVVVSAICSTESYFSRGHLQKDSVRRYKSHQEKLKTSSKKNQNRCMPALTCSLHHSNNINSIRLNWVLLSPQVTTIVTFSLNQVRWFWFHSGKSSRLAGNKSSKAYFFRANELQSEAVGSLQIGFSAPGFSGSCCDPHVKLWHAKILAACYSKRTARIGHKDRVRWRLI